MSLPPLQPGPAAPGGRHPLAGASNAQQLQAVLTGTCCEYGDGSGKFDANAALTLFQGFHLSMITSALAASDLNSLTWLGRSLHYFHRGLPPALCPAVAEIRACLSQEIKGKLPTAGDAKTLAYAINLECFDHYSGSGKIDVHAASRLFEGYTAAHFSGVLATADRSSLAYLSTSLESLAGALGPRGGEGLDQVRAAVAEAQARALREAQERLVSASDADSLAQAIARACCLSDLGYRNIDATAARQLFASYDVNYTHRMLAVSSGPALSKLARLLQHLSKALVPPCEELEQLRNATTLALERWLGIVHEELAEPSDAEALIDVIAAACCEYGDGSGEVTEQAVRLLFDGLPAETLAQAAAAAGLATVQKLRLILGRIRKTLEDAGAARCLGLDQTMTAAVPAIRAALTQVPDVNALCGAITSVCCEYSDGSGRIFAEDARRLFDGLRPERFQHLLSAADRTSRQKLARLLQKLALTVGYPRCEGLEALRRAIPM